MKAESFSKNALALLEHNANNKYYVYRLLDPRTYVTFYVGKGCGNRVFEHSKAARALISEEEDSDSLKLKLISEILAENKQVICVLHRWGLSQKAALEVEAALIDCYPGLTNIQKGNGFARGLISVEDFEAMSNTAEYEEPEDDYIIIKTSQNAINNNGSLYEATRRAWKAKLNRAQKYKYVLSVINGIVREVYEVDEWHAINDRIEFTGKETTDSIAALKGYLIPERYRKKGASNPFMYKK